MKLILLLPLFFVALLPAALHAQQLPDSIVQKQLLNQKKQLALTDAQFDKYKKLSSKYHEKMGNLAVTMKDTAVFNKQAVEVHKKHMSDLKELLTPQQMDMYSAAMKINWQKFQDHADKNHIKTSGRKTANQ